MRTRLIIDGNAVYEIDDECMKKKQGNSGGRASGNLNSFTGQEQDKKQTSSKS